MFFGAISLRDAFAFKSGFEADKAKGVWRVAPVPEEAFATFIDAWVCIPWIHYMLPPRSS